MPTVNPITSAGEERIANKTWINGQILYQKNIKIASIPSGTNFFDTEEEFDQLDQLYMLEGIGYVSSINNYKTYNDKSYDINITYDKETGYIRAVVNNNSYAPVTDNIINFYYTKAERARFRIANVGESTDYYPVTGVNVNGVSVLDNERVAQITSYKEITQAEYDALPDSKRSDNVMYCIKDSAPSGLDREIIDVQLNGYSIVDQYGIANITDVATAMDLATKQDLLVEGSNITMQRLQDGTVRISATTSGGGSTSGVQDVTVNGQSVVSGTTAIITIPTKTSDLNNDSGYITVSVNNLTNYYTKTQVDDIINGIPDATVTSHGLMTATQVTTLNNIASSLPNKQNALTAGTGINISSDEISVKSMTGATSSADGTLGGVPAPRVADRTKYLKGDGTWDTPPGSGGASSLNDLTDVNITTAVDGQTLIYNATNQEWINSSTGGGSGNVDDVQMNGQSIVTNKVASFNNYVELTQAQYDALPASKLTDGILYCIKDTGIVEGNQFTPVIYSLEEREIGTWTDGKPLYQITKIIPFSSTTTTGTIIEIPLLSSGQNLINIVEAFATDLTYGDIRYGLTAYVSNNSTGRWFEFARWYGGLCICTTSTTYTANINDIRITYQYTKTTDVPGSGSWTIGGVPTHHYSTTEQVIGTWIDGSTLYEKTISFGSLPNNTSKEVAHGLSNIGHIWIAGGFAEDPNSGFTNQLSLANTTGDWYFGVDKTRILCTTASNRSNYSYCFVTLQYTKSS